MFKGLSPDVQIGRVYVDDPDDWDLPDKIFQWADFANPYFSLEINGTITMKKGAPEDQYTLNFKVTEESPLIPYHQESATVAVTVKYIPEEAVRKSGSIRMQGVTVEEFIEKFPDEVNLRFVVLF